MTQEEEKQRLGHCRKNVQNIFSECITMTLVCVLNAQDCHIYHHTRSQCSIIQSSVLLFYLFIFQEKCHCSFIYQAKFIFMTRYIWLYSHINYLEFHQYIIGLIQTLLLLILFIDKRSRDNTLFKQKFNSILHRKKLFKLYEYNRSRNELFFNFYYIIRKLRTKNIILQFRPILIDFDHT